MAGAKGVAPLSFSFKGCRNELLYYTPIKWLSRLDSHQCLTVSETDVILLLYYETIQMAVSGGLAPPQNELTAQRATLTLRHNENGGAGGSCILTQRGKSPLC